MNRSVRGHQLPTTTPAPWKGMMGHILDPVSAYHFITKTSIDFAVYLVDFAVYLVDTEVHLMDTEVHSDIKSEIWRLNYALFPRHLRRKTL